jgi:hypothetical protein
MTEDNLKELGRRRMTESDSVRRIAKAFDNLMHDKSSHGVWMRGEIFYHINGDGEIDLIDGLKMTLCGDQPKLPEVSGWLPIHTAPKDRMTLLYRPTANAWGKVSIGKWQSQQHHKKPRPFWEGWIKIMSVTDSREWEPTHWMPLPDAPEQS